jgi:hypothetical protein
VQEQSEVEVRGARVGVQTFQGEPGQRERRHGGVLQDEGDLEQRCCRRAA